MKLKTKIHKIERQIESRIDHERSKAERVGALALACVTIFGLTNLSGEQASKQAGAAVVPAIATFSPVFERVVNPSNHETGQSEVSRMPVKFDEGLRLPTISGE